MKKLENNKINISVISYENKNPYPIYTSKQAFETHVDLLRY